MVSSAKACKQQSPRNIAVGKSAFLEALEIIAKTDDPLFLVVSIGDCLDRRQLYGSQFSEFDIINYEQHIHPLWSATRDLGMGTFTCQSCHNATTAGDNDPATGFLDLSDGFSGAVPTQYNSYRELLFSKDVLADLGNTDINGNPILDTITVNPTMSVGGARASNAFFSRFETGGIHEGYLTPAELRLIAEWLDIGAQYFNNPSDPDVPVN